MLGLIASSEQRRASNESISYPCRVVAALILAYFCGYYFSSSSDWFLQLFVSNDGSRIHGGDKKRIRSPQTPAAAAM